MRISFGPAVLVAGAVAGYVAGVQALGKAGQYSVGEGGHWKQETTNPKDVYLIYALGHFRSLGLLPPGHDTAYYTRDLDEDGNALRSTCSYILSGQEPAARWWSVNAMPEGTPQKAISLTAADAVLTGDKELKLAISRHMQPGNLLQVEDFGPMRVTLVLNAPYPPKKDEALKLPSLKKVTCE
ncbi:DUF1214 domain-containing protein [Aestuariivirga litoralis]|uniref:DUF1214 domain-containing protein n=1 Tax=Aestuariivirga litoralis TaxID=2650924 RepID=UPI0018C72867|nr:DUF1214 domain-containing protein [Aestuariivirga litoralis]MBG1232250.1 DUF1214 domain-containing protein [Aestuariivirga litoralis]